MVAVFGPSAGSSELRPPGLSVLIDPCHGDHSISAAQRGLRGHGPRVTHVRPRLVAVDKVGIDLSFVGA
jgi:hypothetical protein